MLLFALPMSKCILLVSKYTFTMSKWILRMSKYILRMSKCTFTMSKYTFTMSKYILRMSKYILLMSKYTFTMSKRILLVFAVVKPDGFAGDFLNEKEDWNCGCCLVLYMEKPPRLSGTPPREGKSRVKFPYFGGVFAAADGVVFFFCGFIL
jgi:hypothetical protein